MKYEGFKEVESKSYPSEEVHYKRSSKVLSFVMLNLIFCLLAVSVIIAVRYFGGSAEEVLNSITQTIAKGI